MPDPNPETTCQTPPNLDPFCADLVSANSMLAKLISEV
jgi:hypothetical protein